MSRLLLNLLVLNMCKLQSAGYDMRYGADVESLEIELQKIEMVFCIMCVQNSRLLNMFYVRNCFVCGLFFSQIYNYFLLHPSRYQTQTTVLKDIGSRSKMMMVRGHQATILPLCWVNTSSRLLQFARHSLWLTHYPVSAQSIHSMQQIENTTNLTTL